MEREEFEEEEEEEGNKQTVLGTGWVGGVEAT